MEWTIAVIYVEENAPVVESGQIHVAASVQSVWNVLSAIERWPEWNPEIREVRLDGPVVDGTRFRWRSGSAKITSTLLEVEPPRFIAWSGSMLGIRAVHVWRLDRSADGTVVTTEESWRGIVPRVFRGRCRSILSASIRSGLGYLKRRAE